VRVFNSLYLSGVFLSSTRALSFFGEAAEDGGLPAILRSRVTSPEADTVETTSRRSPFGVVEDSARTFGSVGGDGSGVTVGLAIFGIVRVRVRGRGLMLENLQRVVVPGRTRTVS
jgi:hypothetical protein